MIKLIIFIGLIVFRAFNFGNEVFTMNEIQNDIIKVLINEQEISFENPLPIINNRVGFYSKINRTIYGECCLKELYI